VSLTPFFDKSRCPSPQELSACLGTAQPVWAGLVRHALEISPLVKEVWNFGGPKIGWSLRLVQKDRILLYLTPGEHRFRAGIVLGKKAVASARETLSTKALSVIAAAPTYAEGHGVRVEVASSADGGVVRELLAVKVGAPATSTSRRTRA